MKRLVSIIIGIMAFTQAFGQNSSFQPKETWPFIYENFSDGVVCTFNQDAILEGLLNISVLNQKLYYIDDGKIMEADIMRVYSARIGKDVFVNAAGKMYKVLAETDGGAVLSGKTVDYDELSKSDIGYGVSSSTASTQNVSGFAIDSNVGVSFNQAIADKNNGKDLPVLSNTYILYANNHIVRASKGEVLRIPGLDKKAVKAFIKEKQIKWNRTESLVLVADYLTETLK